MKKKFVKRGIVILLGIIVTAVLLFTIINKDTSKELFNIAGRMINALTSDYTANGISYKIIDEENKYVEVSTYTGAENTVEIPETIEKNNITYTVTKIGDNAFKDNTTIKGINMPDSITIIGENAFKGCTSFEGIGTSSSSRLTIIGKEAFAGDIALTHMPSLGNVTEIGESAFYGCASIKTIDFIGVTAINKSVFENCNSLRYINEMSNDVITIGENAFKGCTSFEGIGTSSSSRLTTIGKEAFAGDVALTHTPSLENVTEIGESAFKGCNSLESTGLEANTALTIINKGTFENCNSIKGLFLPARIYTIGESAFKGCTSLETIEMNSTNQLTTIEKNAFENCTSLPIVYLENVRTIGEEAFKGCTELELIKVSSTTNVPDNVTDNEHTIIGYVYNNVMYKINDDGETVTVLLNESEVELPETVIINNKAYRVVEIDTQENIEISCNINSETEWIKEKAILNIEVSTENTELKSITLNNEAIELTDGKVSVEITGNGKYTVKAVSKSDKEYIQEITISNIIKLTGIEVEEEPSKKEYIEGQIFDKNGMKVKAIYDNENYTEEITDYTILNGDTLQEGQTSVTISYTENGVTKTANQNITVVAKALTGISVTKAPTRTSYVAGENFDRTGMTVTANYNNGSSTVVTNYTIEGENSLVEGTTKLIVNYTENGITKTSEIEGITVTKKVEELHAEFEGYEEKEEENIKYIEKIMPETKIETLKSKITTNGKIIEIYNNKNEKITNENEFIATGMEIVIKLGEQEQRYIVVVIGDLNSDGKIGVGDLLRLSRYEAKIDTNLTGAYLRASDVAGKGKYGGIGNITKMSRIIAKIDNL